MTPPPPPPPTVGAIPNQQPPPPAGQNIAPPGAFPGKQPYNSTVAQYKCISVLTCPLLLCYQVHWHPVGTIHLHWMQMQRATIVGRGLTCGNELPIPWIPTRVIRSRRSSDPDTGRTPIEAPRRRQKLLDLTWTHIFQKISFATVTKYIYTYKLYIHLSL